MVRPWVVKDDFGLVDSEIRRTDLNGRITRILLIQNGKLVSRLFQMVRLPKLAFRSIQLVVGMMIAVKVRALQTISLRAFQTLKLFAETVSLIG